MESKKNNQPLDLAVTDPEWTAITTAFAGQEVPAASPLTGKERWLCVLSALLGCQGMGAFRKALGSALDDGVEPVAVREVIYQATAYLGIGRVQDFLLAAGDDYHISIFRKQHSDIESRLTELRDILIKYYTGKTGHVFHAVLFDIFTCADDLRQHNTVEDCLLVPLIELLEK